MITVKKIHIKNFRSIVDASIDLSDFNCFVGKNDSGKSNVLKALNLFFNGKTDFNTEFDFFSDYSRFAKHSPKHAKEITISLEILIPDSFKESGIKTWKKVWRINGLHSDNLQEIFNAGSKGLTLLGRIQYLYIPAVKSNEFFKDLLSDVYTSMTKAANSALKGLNKKYSDQLQTLTKELSDQIQSVLGIHSAIQMPENLNVFFRDLSFSTSDKYVHSINLDHRGDGIKARHIPSILRYMQTNTEKGRPRGSVNGAYIWGFEEPENGVEYLACFEMAKEFFAYTKDCQILLTTHSPAFYTQSRGCNSSCYMVGKNNLGASVYLQEDQVTINSTMGLMQLVAPFIKDAMNEYVKGMSSGNHKLINQLMRVMNIMRRSDQDLDVKQVLTVIEQYADALDMLDDFDHQRISKPDGSAEVYHLEYSECRELIDQMKYSAESNLFGNEKDDSFKGSIGNIYQTFGGVDLYPSVEEKAANLLYLITKNHSFSDGNKRIAAAVFLYFLEKNRLLFRDGEKRISDHTLVAIIVMIAESNAEEKEIMVNLVMNFLSQG